MKRIALLALSALVLLPTIGLAQQTPAPAVDTYESLADTILGLRQAELNFVRTILDGHFHAAKAYMKMGDWDRVAAEMALFANEGDNGIGGVRKRLLEGGHHFNAEGEDQGIFEPGYVVVTREAKKKILATSASLRQAGSDADRKAAWKSFTAAAHELLKSD